MIDDLIGMQPVVPPAPVEDLASLDGAATRVCIKGTTKNLERLGELTSLEAMWAGDINHAQFARIVTLIDPLYLMFDGLRVAELSPLGRLSRLQALEVRWNTKVSDISFLERLTGLRLLALSHCPRVQELGPIAALGDLEVLELSGGMWSTFRPDTLKPLAELDKLWGLSLTNIRVADESLAPVAQLKSLRKLELSNQFPTEEYARLSVALPQVECTHFVPYFEVNFGKGRQVMVTGKGKPVLTLPRDQARLDGYVERFRAAQTRFRETY